MENSWESETPTPFAIICFVEKRKAIKKGIKIIDVIIWILEKNNLSYFQRLGISGITEKNRTYSIYKKGYFQRPFLT